jgi:DNA-binding NtrC family response regulator
MSDAFLAAKTVMVVEDEFFIAEVLCEALAMQNWQVVGPYPDMESASNALDNGAQVDVAILDVNLKGKLAYPLVDRLIQKDTPVILTTGYDRDAVPPAYAHLPRLIKPVSLNELLDCVAQAIRPRDDSPAHS